MASSLADLKVRPHDRFFFSDGSLYLVVENSLYCVHKSFFEIHAPMFPVRDSKTSRNKPYILEDVKTSDFDRLLAHLYPRTLGVEETETTQDWISVLRLASKWGFSSLRSKAISKVERTLEFPIDMVTLGRQYGIPNVLFPGYAVLCQSTVPLSYEEGLLLGMQDVVNIYRIRHELYGSGIAPVSLKVAFAKVKAGLEIEQPRQELDSEQASTWMWDIESVIASQTSTEKKERGTFTLSPDVDSSSLDVASTDVATLVSEIPEQPCVYVHSPSDKATSVVLGSRGSDIPSSVSDNVLSLDIELSKSDREGFQLLDDLNTENFDIVSVEIMEWVNTKDIQTLHQITRLTIEKAVSTDSKSYCCYDGLFFIMVKYIQTLHCMTRLIVERAMEEPHRIWACASLCNRIINHTRVYGNPTVTAGGLSFSQYLGEICQENLEAIAASVACASNHTARVRRWRLIEFIGKLAQLKAVHMWAPTINKWVTALLDADNEEKVTTLCMAMTRVSQLCTACDMDRWLQRAKKVAQETSKPRVRKLLNGVRLAEGESNKKIWLIAQPDEDCTVQ